MSWIQTVLLQQHKGWWRHAITMALARNEDTISLSRKQVRNRDNSQEQESDSHPMRTSRANISRMMTWHHPVWDEEQQETNDVRHQKQQDKTQMAFLDMNEHTCTTGYITGISQENAIIMTCPR